MTIKHITSTAQRHANQFTGGTEVFSATDSGHHVSVRCEHWNDKQKGFYIYLDGVKVTGSSNYPKAIGLALIELLTKSS